MVVYFSQANRVLRRVRLRGEHAWKQSKKRNRTTVSTDAIASKANAQNASPVITLPDDAQIDARKATIGYRVFLAIKQAIVQGKLAPGHPVSEAELARQLGVSRQPVREAFIKLSDLGLVEIRPQRGTFVQLISRREVENARFIREAIEVAVVRRAAEIATEQAVAPLFDLIQAQKATGNQPDESEFLRLDDMLHRVIASIADCDHAWRVAEDLKVQMDRVRYLSIAHATPVETIISQHERIVAAIANNDPDTAEAEMRVHLKEILRSLPVIADDNRNAFLSDADRA